MAKVLLIEDEEMVRFSLRAVLESDGHEVIEASNGDEGISQFKKLSKTSQPMDLVVTDILMPKKHGYDTISEIRELSPNMKIIAISGGGEVNPKVFLDMSDFLGANRVLAKPFSSDELLTAVKECLT